MEERKFKTFRELKDTDMVFVFNEDELQLYKTVLGNYQYKDALKGYDYVQMIYGMSTVNKKHINF